MKSIFFLLLFIFIGINLVQADSIKTITLTDGSVIKGELMSFQNGTYTIRTESMGVVILQDENIQTIANASAATLPNLAVTSNPALPSANDPALQEKIVAIQSDVLSDPVLMQEIQSLLNDDEIKRALANPKFIEDVMSFDPQKIQNNPELMHLLENPNMQKIMNKVRQKLPTQ